MRHKNEEHGGLLVPKQDTRPSKLKERTVKNDKRRGKKNYLCSVSGATKHISLVVRQRSLQLVVFLWHRPRTVDTPANFEITSDPNVQGTVGDPRTSAYEFRPSMDWRTIRLLVGLARHVLRRDRSILSVIRRAINNPLVAQKATADQLN